MEFSPSLASLDAGVAISGILDPVPHLVQPISGDNDVYRETVIAKLALYALTNVPIEVIQAVRIDLEGDGVNEVIFVAQHPGANEFLREPGVFSMVVLRRVVNEVVQSITLHESVFTAADVGFATSVYRAELAAVADLNGDGTMEIVLNGAYYEGEWSVAIESRDEGTVVDVLGCGLGV
jgi:hypothetical protein